MVKEWLKSVLNYRSYPKNKIGYPFFGTPCSSISWCVALIRIFVQHTDKKVIIV